MYSNLVFLTGVFLMVMSTIPLIGKKAEYQTRKPNIRIENFIVYRDAVREYMAGHPGFDGTIGSSSLDLPGTYNNLGWSNTVNSGTAWIYGDMPAGGLRHAVEKMDQPLNLGVKAATGYLVSPVYGNTGIYVSPSVSVGQVVAVVKNI